MKGQEGKLSSRKDRRSILSTRQPPKPPRQAGKLDKQGIVSHVVFLAHGLNSIYEYGAIVAGKCGVLMQVPLYGRARVHSSENVQKTALTRYGTIVFESGIASVATEAVQISPCDGDRLWSFVPNNSIVWRDLMLCTFFSCSYSTATYTWTRVLARSYFTGCGCDTSCRFADDCRLGAWVPLMGTQGDIFSIQCWVWWLNWDNGGSNRNGSCSWSWRNREWLIWLIPF